MGGVDLIERQAPAEDLGGWLDEAREGAGSLVLIAGEAGVGKTRFAERTAQAHGVPLHRGSPGSAAVTFAATINSTLQLAVSPEMRGRVMALYSVVFLGSTPFGAPLTGWLAQSYDPRIALLLAGAAGLAAAWAAQISFERLSAGRSR